MEAREMIPNDALTVDRELGIGLMAHHWNKSKPPHGRRHFRLWKCITSLKRLTHEFYGLPYQTSGWPRRVLVYLAEGATLLKHLYYSVSPFRWMRWIPHFS
jgi:hypothetical protein